MEMNFASEGSGIVASYIAGRRERQEYRYPAIDRIMLEAITESGLSGRTILVANAECALDFVKSAAIDCLVQSHGYGIDAAAAIKRVCPDNLVVCYGGAEIATVDAGGALNAAARADKITVVMLNSGYFTGYGGQMSATTPMDMVTSTSPEGRNAALGYPLHMPEMLAEVTGAVYSARGAVNSESNAEYVKTLIKTAIKKQMGNLGFSFVEIIPSSPPSDEVGFLDGSKSIDDGMENEFPLGEFKNVEMIELPL